MLPSELNAIHVPQPLPKSVWAFPPPQGSVPWQLSKGLVELSSDAELNPGMQRQASVLTHRGFGGHHQAQAVREEAVGMETQSEGQGGAKSASSWWSRSRGREGMDGMASIRSCCLDTKSCLTVCDPMDFSPPDSMRFSWQEHQSGLPFPLPGSFHYPGIKPVSYIDRHILYHWVIWEALHWNKKRQELLSILRWRGIAFLTLIKLCLSLTFKIILPSSSFVGKRM